MYNVQGSCGCGRQQRLWDQFAGIVERMNRTIKTRLSKALLEKDSSWVTCLPAVLMGIRATAASTTGITPFELMTGRKMPICFPNEPRVSEPIKNAIARDMFLQQVQENLKELLPYAAIRMHKSYLQGETPMPSVGSLVMVKVFHIAGPWDANWEGPYKVLEVMGDTMLKKVGQSFSLSVCSKVHGSAIWSCNYGQGQYMLFTAHWVNVVPLQQQQQLGQVTPLQPPRSLALPLTPCDSASSSSAISSPSTVGSSLSAPAVYHVCRARRCHAVLHMVCLGERSHTGEELLKFIHHKIQTWLTPRNLKMGIMVTDNGKNILSALPQGSLTHAPCMTHIFNLIVKRFLRFSPHLQDILTTSRKLCMHFSHSYTAKHTLLELQRQNGRPQHSLICDVSTRWNSTLHMLDRLYEQRKAITDFLMIQADRGTPLCNFNVNQWQLIRDTCRLLRPFEEATLFVSRQDYGMNDVIPLLHVLQHMLETMAGQGTGDMAYTSYGHMNTVGAELEEEEEEEEEQEGHSEAQFRLGEMAGLSSQRTEEEEQEQPEELEGFEEGETADPDTPWQYAVEMETGSPSDSLAQMAGSMLTCLRSDPRIVSNCRRDDFWLSTLLDPRFRHKMGAFFKPAEREDKLNYYKDILRSQLADAYLRHDPYSRRSDSGGPLRSPCTAMPTGGIAKYVLKLREGYTDVKREVAENKCEASIRHLLLEVVSFNRRQHCDSREQETTVVFLY
ncbi:LOW QUALITY PROTEIN: uncharacterized protein PAF06_000468 [Gastrophryne carolinensis]